MGALAGHVFADALSALLPARLALDPHIYAIIGMGALSVCVIGGPLTMTFIALETTGDLWSGADCGDRVGASDPRNLRLFLRDLAIPSAR